jgi:hypothetical protein
MIGLPWNLPPTECVERIGAFGALVEVSAVTILLSQLGRAKAQ